MNYERPKPYSIWLLLLWTILAGGIFWLPAGLLWYFDIGGEGWFTYSLIVAALYTGIMVPTLIAAMVLSLIEKIIVAPSFPADSRFVTAALSFWHVEFCISLQKTYFAY